MHPARKQTLSGGFQFTVALLAAQLELHHPRVRLRNLQVAVKHHF